MIPEEDLTAILVAEANDLLPWKVRTYRAEAKIRELEAELVVLREKDNG